MTLQPWRIPMLAYLLAMYELFTEKILPTEAGNVQRGGRGRRELDVLLDDDGLRTCCWGGYAPARRE